MQNKNYTRMRQGAVAIIKITCNKVNYTFLFLLNFVRLFKEGTVNG